MTRIKAVVMDEHAKEFERIAHENGLMTSELLMKFVGGIVYGKFEVRDDVIVPTEEYLEVLNKKYGRN